MTLEKGTVEGAGIVQRGNHDDLGRLGRRDALAIFQVAHAFQGLVPVHARHHDIHENDVVGGAGAQGLLERGQPPPAVFGDFALGIGGQNFREETRIDRVVIDDKGA